MIAWAFLIAWLVGRAHGELSLSWHVYQCRRRLAAN